MHHDVDYASFVAQEIVGFTFAWAATAKIRSFPAFTDALSLALPRGCAVVTGLAVITLEGAIALMLVAQVFAQFAAMLAAGLLCIFTAFLALGILRRSTTPCNCFGAGAGKTIGPVDIARNAGLLVLAIYGTLVPPGHVRAVVKGIIVTYANNLTYQPSNLLVVGALLTQTLVFWYLVRHLSHPRQSTQALQSIPAVKRASLIGYQVSDILQPIVHGPPRTLLSVFSRFEFTLLIFVGAACSDCQKLLLKMEDPPPDGSRAIALIVSGAHGSSEASARFANVFTQKDASLARSLGVMRTPSSVLVDRSGRVMSVVHVGMAEAEAQLRTMNAIVEHQKLNWTTVPEYQTAEQSY